MTGRGFLWMACVCALWACEGAVSGGAGADLDGSQHQNGDSSVQPGDHDANVNPGDHDAATNTQQDGAMSMMDAAPPDSGTTPGCGNALFCDDFEGYGAASAPGSPWMLTSDGGAVTLSGDKHVSGGHSVHITTVAQGNAYQRAFMQLKSPYFPVNGNHFFGRVYVWLKAAPSQNSHWTMIQGSGPYSGYGHSGTANVRYGGMISQRLMANYDSSGAATDCATTSAMTAPEGGWNCIEWEFDGTTNTMHYWVDSAAVNDMTIVDHGGSCNSGHDLQDHWVFPNFETLSLGWEHYQTSDPIDMYMDDVAIGTARIGCQ